LSFEPLAEIVILGVLLILAFIVWVIILLAILRVIGFIIGIILSTVSRKSSVGIINIHGPINSLNEPKRPSTGVTYEGINKLIKKAVADGVVGIILDVDSPGGQVAASFKIAKKIAGLKVPVVAVIKDVGASGGYLIASACKKIIADEWSNIGSIGVIMPLFEAEKLLDKAGLGFYPDLKAGKYKDLGLPYRRMADDEVQLLKDDIAITYDSFVEFVADHRHLDINDVRSLATGKTYFGEKSLELGLIDKLGDIDTAVKELKSLTGKKKIKTVSYRPKQKSRFLFPFLDELSLRAGKHFARGFWESNVKEMSERKKIEL